MKKIWTVASLVVLVSLPLSAALAAPLSGAAQTSGRHAGKIVKPVTGLAKKPYRYLDMVARKRSSAIRNAVIVYDYDFNESKPGKCDVSDAKSVSACLHGPST